jgi:hypothetical protein
VDVGWGTPFPGHFDNHSSNVPPAPSNLETQFRAAEGRETPPRAKEPGPAVRTGQSYQGE